MGEMILPVFKEIYYLSHEQMNLLAKSVEYEAQPERVPENEGRLPFWQ
ncbi:MAG: hypothetical protein V8S26_06780 [Lachnospiraceae bacterium]